MQGPSIKTDASPACAATTRTPRRIEGMQDFFCRFFGIAYGPFRVILPLYVVALL